jgi:ribosomal protein S8
MYITPNPLILQFLNMFKNIGVIMSFYFINENKIEILFKYRHNRSNLGAFIHMKLISKPSKRVYVDVIKLMKLKQR